MKYFMRRSVQAEQYFGPRDNVKINDLVRDKADVLLDNGILSIDGKIVNVGSFVILSEDGSVYIFEEEAFNTLFVRGKE